MKKHSPHPHSITVLSWHLSKTETVRPTGNKNAKIESCYDDSKKLPAPSLSLAAS